MRCAPAAQGTRPDRVRGDAQAVELSCQWKAALLGTRSCGLVWVGEVAARRLRTKDLRKHVVTGTQKNTAVMRGGSTAA